MLPPWDDGAEFQSDFQFTEFLRTVDAAKVAKDQRRIHTLTYAELNHYTHRAARVVADADGIRRKRRIGRSDPPTS